MSGWTPGPWLTQETEKTPNGLDELIRTENNTWIGWAYDKQNANLIAAAPDLYAALDWLCRALVHDHNKNIDYWAEALAALAKARGES